MLQSNDSAIADTVLGEYEFRCYVMFSTHYQLKFKV
jgi:hypothetical protein